MIEASGIKKWVTEEDVRVTNLPEQASGNHNREVKSAYKQDLQAIILSVSAKRDVQVVCVFNNPPVAFNSQLLAQQFACSEALNIATATLTSGAFHDAMLRKRQRQRAGQQRHPRRADFRRRHGYRNSGKSVARVLWVNTPVTF